MEHQNGSFDRICFMTQFRVKIQKETCEEILSRYSPAPPEEGGILGMRGGVICRYVHDVSRPVTDRAVYVPDTAFLNRCIAGWFDEGIDFCGIAHSHPAGQDTLSSGDLAYIEKLYRANGQLGTLYFPLILGGRDMPVFAACMQNGQLMTGKAAVEIVDGGIYISPVFQV